MLTVTRVSKTHKEIENLIEEMYQKCDQVGIKRPTVTFDDSNVSISLPETIKLGDWNKTTGVLIENLTK